jgi:hypothetical protein
MSSLFEDFLPSIFKQHKSNGANSKFSEAEIEAATEAAVIGVDTGIRLLSGYQARLRPAVESALSYVNCLVEHIPGVLEVDSRSFSTDPRVNAFFVDVNDLRSVFSRSSELRDFLSDVHNEDLERCCALLCMKKTERNVLGVELRGDQVRRDVKQVTVSFDDHQIISPAGSEAEVRQGLKTCLFQSLITNALGRLASCHVSVQHMDAERRSLSARLRSLESAAEAGAENANEVEELRAHLAGIESTRGQAPCLSPEHSLRQLLEVLEAPDQFVRLNSDRLSLDRLGIKLSEDNGAEPIELAEVDLGSGNRRVVVLTSFPLGEMLPQQDLLANMSRFLQI